MWTSVNYPKNNKRHINNMPHATGIIRRRQAHKSTHSTCLQIKIGPFFIFIKPFLLLLLPEGRRICDQIVSCPCETPQGGEVPILCYGTVCVTTGIPCRSQEIWNRSLHLHTVAPGWGWVQARTLCLWNNYSGTAPWGAAALCRETSQ